MNLAKLCENLIIRQEKLAEKYAINNTTQSEEEVFLTSGNHCEPVGAQYLVPFQRGNSEPIPEKSNITPDEFSHGILHYGLPSLRTTDKRYKLSSIFLSLKLSLFSIKNSINKKSLRRFLYNMELFTYAAILFFIEAFALLFLETKDSFLIFANRHRILGRQEQSLLLVQSSSIEPERLGFRKSGTTRGGVDGKVCGEIETEGSIGTIEPTRGTIEPTLYSVYSYHKHKQMVGRVRFFTKSAFACILVSTVLVSSIFYFLLPGKPNAKAATFNWVQSDWSLGADVAAVATYALNQTGWQKFYSKTDSITASSNQVTLTNPDSSVTKTSDADFNAGTIGSQSYVTGGTITMKKQNGRGCTADGQCVSDFCNGSSVCAVGPWISGSGLSGCSAGIGVYNVDISGTKQWKTTDDACVSPQCVSSTLVSGNGIDFSLYPARNACKALGGRLPTRAELLTCIYPNKVSLGNNFQSSYYWSSEEFGATTAYYVILTNGSTSSGDPSGYFKTSIHFVRCVKGQ